MDRIGRRLGGCSSKRFVAFVAFVLAALTMPAPARADYLPSIKIGRAALISPSNANSFYTNSPDHTDQLYQYTHVTTPTPPEIAELARALRNNVDLIYQYVHNNVQTVWMYGLQKGALGAEIDKSGTPFDQAVLMVALLRQGSNPYAASYVAGTIVLNQQQFSGLTGISRARAACRFLSDGGIPASINGATDITSCSDTFGANTNVTSVQMAHIWVRVTISGTNYVFDPSIKTLDWKPGIDLPTAMGFTSGDPLAAATNGYDHGTVSGVSYVQGLNAGALNSDLQDWSSNLFTYIRQNDHLSGAQLVDIVGGAVIVPDYGTLRQTTLPYADPNPPYTARVWTPPADAAGYNAIPDKYRTFITIDGQATEYNDEYKPVYKRMFYDAGLPKLFADEIYGRRLTIETNFTVQGINTQGDYYPQRACLALDAGSWTTWTADERPSWCLGPLHYDYEVGGDWFHVVPARGLPTHIILTANHPYAASANGTAQTDGDYMDAAVDKRVGLITPLTIVHGWGDAGSTLFNKWTGEREADSALPPLRQPPWCPSDDDQCAQLYLQPTGNFSREKLAANWLAQFTRAGQLNAALANSVLQIHHTLGFIYGDSNLQGFSAFPEDLHPSYTIGDNFDRIDVDAGISMTNRGADSTARKTALLAFAAEAAAMEGAAGAQFADVPDTVSTATRFEWGNDPDSDGSQNPYGIGPQKFLQFNSDNYAQTLNLIQVDGHAAASCNGTGVDAWDAQPTMTPNQCYGSGPGHCIHEDGGIVVGTACHVADEIGLYAQAGFRVVASQEAFLGPGQRGGLIIPITQGESHFPQTYQHHMGKQRGGAFVAIKADENGEPLEIAHIVTGAGSPSLPGGILAKGGGAGGEPQNYTDYDPSSAADVLKAKFVDRSNLFGVDLANGSLGYTSPVTLRIGNGGFPYELSASVSWHPGAREPNWAMLSPIAPQSGWVHSWSNSLSLSGSTLEALGQSDIRGAVGAIVAFYATQDIYGAAASPQRDVAAVLTQAWWAHQLSGNVATINIGGKARQFIKVASHAWILPGTDYATLTQTGSRVAFEQKCFGGFASNPPYALARGWDNSGLSFTVTNAHGDQQNFEYFERPYHTDDKRQCGRLTAFRLKNWTFPYGMTVTPFYDHFDNADDDTVDYLADVHNSIGRKLTFPLNTNTITNGLTGADARSISFTQPVLNASTMTDVLAHDTTFDFVGPFETSASQRPVPYVLLNRVTAPGGAKQAEYDYDSLGRVNQVKDAVALLPDSTRNPYRFYIADGARGERVDPLNQNYVVQYDTYGHPSRYRDELGHETAALFDSRGRAMQYVYPEGDCERFDYDLHSNTISYKRIDKVSSCDPNAGSAHVLSASASYDPTWNKPLTVNNFRNKQTVLTYYDDAETGASLLHTATRPSITEGQPVYTFTYTNIGKVDTSTGPTGIATKNNYESSSSRNLLSTVLDPGSGTHLNLTTTFGYDAQGDVTLTVDPRSNATTSLYEKDRLKKQDDYHKGGQNADLNAASRTIYDLLRRVDHEDAGLTFSTTGTPTVLTWQTNKTITYTATSKVETVKDADNRITTTKYDDDDRVLTISDPEDRKTHFVYCAPGDANCAANQVAIELRAWGGNNNHCSVSDGLQQCYRRLTYGADGEQLSLQDANGNITAYGYDDFLRLTKTTFPDSSYEQLTLDSNDNVTARRNRAGETLTYQYNDLDWIVQKTSPNPAVTDYWTYLLDGRIDTLCDGTDCDSAPNKLDYRYDAAGRLTDSIVHIPGFGSDRGTHYTLDANGNRTKLLWAVSDGSYYVGYCYDNLNRMTVAMENSTDSGCATNKLATYVYDPLSRRTKVTYGNNASMAYSYFDAGDLKTLNHNMSGSANDVHYTFTYTDAHEVRTEDINKSAYAWQPSAPVTNAAYAPANNLNQYPSYNQGLLSIPRPLTYDAKGNLIVGAFDYSGTWQFGYDAENRLTSACKPYASGACSSPTVNATYAYDPLGRRTKKSGTGIATAYYLNDGDDEVVEYDGSKAVVALYVPGPAIDEPIAVSTPNGSGGYTHEYFHTNHQGSVIAMSDDATGKVEGPFLYDPFGNCFSGATACGSLSNSVPYKFTGRRLDPVTGLYYYRARYYSSVLGRFLQTDPIGYTADLNLYTYVGNDPVDMTDPYGEAADQNCTTDSNGTTTCQPIETVVVTAQRPPPPKAPPSPVHTVGAGAIALPAPAVGGLGGLRGLITAIPRLMPELLLPLATCGDTPAACGPTVNEAKQKPPRADKGKERGKKEALKQFRTNKDFRQWFHRNFKGGPGGQGIPAGNTRNPDLGEDAIQDAWEEYQQQGGR